jgi:hypothetical protein
MGNTGKPLYGAVGGLCFALATALLAYPMASAYHTGYIREWGLPSGLLPLGYEFANPVWVFGVPFPSLGISLIGAAIAVAVVVALSFLIQRAADRIVRTVEPAGRSKLVLKMFSVMISTLTVVVLSVAAARQAGAAVAQVEGECTESASSAEEEHCGQGSELEFVDRPSSILGHLIGCSERHCVVRRERDIVVVRRADVRNIKMATAGVLSD